MELLVGHSVFVQNVAIDIFGPVLFRVIRVKELLVEHLGKRCVHQIFLLLLLLLFFDGRLGSLLLSALSYGYIDIQVYVTL